MLVQEAPGPVDNPLAPDRVIGPHPFCSSVLGYDIGAVERVVETAPAGIGGIEGKAGVHDGHHQLGPRHGRHLVIDVGRAHLNPVRWGQEVAYFFQVALIGGGIESIAGMLPVPAINAGLQGLPNGQEFLVSSHELG